MAKATAIKDALKKLEESRGVTAAEMEKVGTCKVLCCMHQMQQMF